MAQAKVNPRKTVDDFMKLPDGTLAELIEGQIYMSPSPKARHQIIVGRLDRILGAFVEHHSLGQVLIAPLDVHLPSGDVVEPDVIFVASANAGIIQDWIRGVPDLLIEVLSPENSRHDRIIKRGLYARNGVREYWIIDGEARTVEVLALAETSFELRGSFRDADRIASAVLPGLALQVSDILA